MSQGFFTAFRGRVGLAILVLGLFVARPGVASASVSYTYYPSGSAAGDNTLNGLDHLYYYSWDITGLTSLVSQGIVSASITFTDLYNWNSGANVLHLDLLDSATLGTPVGVSAVVGNVRDAVDSAPTTPTKQSDMTNDAFDAANLLSSSAKTNLSDRSFVGQFTAPTSTSTLNSALIGLTNDVTGGFNGDANDVAWANALITPAGWTLGTTQGPNGGYNYTYTFTAAQLTALGTYITNGGDIALAFDPDCHFFNDGVSFQIVTSGVGITASAVPEPASLLLLGAGLVVAGRYRRRAASRK